MKNRKLSSATLATLAPIALLTLGTPVACKSSDDVAPTPDRSTTTSTSGAALTKTAKAPKKPEVNIPDEALPTEEDFEQEVEETITVKTNLKGALDALEKEIGL